MFKKAFRRRCFTHESGREWTAIFSGSREKNNDFDLNDESITVNVIICSHLSRVSNGTSKHERKWQVWCLADYSM